MTQHAGCNKQKDKRHADHGCAREGRLAAHGRPFNDIIADLQSVCEIIAEPVKSSIALVALATLVVGSAQTKPAPALLAEIEQIRAIDNHAHPGRVLGPEEKEDTEIDALMSFATPTFENYPAPLRLQPDNPEWVQAWRALYDYAYSDNRPEHVAELVRRKQQVMREQGDNYANWVLDRLGIETMVANRIALGRGLKPPRFVWVAFDDALLFPLDNSALKAKNPDLRGFYGDEEALRTRYLKESGLQRLPSTFSDYLQRVVTPTLERQRRQGAIAIKFEAAYLRPLDFGEAAETDARRIYEAHIGGGLASAADYKKLQDFMFRYMAREAGRLGMSVHLHVAGGGVGTYYDPPGGNPMLLASAFDDPALRRTNFVIIHGGEPWTREVRALITKPNVYADFSAQTFLDYPRDLAGTLRLWMEWYPEKVLFGTDTSPGAP